MVDTSKHVFLFPSSPVITCTVQCIPAHCDEPLD